MKRFLIVLVGSLVSINTSGWMRFTNTLSDKLTVILYFGNNTQKTLLLKPYESNVVVYATHDSSHNDELLIKKIEARSTTKIIVDWDPQGINPFLNIPGEPIYGLKKLGNLNLNKKFNCSTKFYSIDPAYEQYNGMIQKCKSSRYGLDVAEHPLDVIIIEQRNKHDTEIIQKLLPASYSVPAGVELGGLELVILAREVKS